MAEMLLFSCILDVEIKLPPAKTLVVHSPTHDLSNLLVDSPLPLVKSDVEASS